MKEGNVVEADFSEPENSVFLGGALLDVIEHAMKELRGTIDIVEARLQVEQNGNAIANLQGQCAGYRTLCKEMKEAGFTDFSENKESEKSILFKKDNGEGLIYYDVAEDVKFETLQRLVVYNKTIQQASFYKTLQENLQVLIDKKKDYLYYEAEKSRDLHFTRGWHEIITFWDTRFDELEKGYQHAKHVKEQEERNKKEMLPFDPEEDDE